MEYIEFMNVTDNRHMKTHIRFKIKEAFRDLNNELNRRKECLKNMLATEELLMEEEMANLFRAKVLENMQKRLDWIATARFEKSEAEREFLKLKQIQRELINCEELRPKESKKISQETKMFQLMQIAEKKQLQMKEKEIEKIWFEASMCLEREKEKQQHYENQLKKIIANNGVDVLNKQLEYIKQIKELENEEKREEQKKIERELHEDVLRTEFESRHNLSKKADEGIRRKNQLSYLEAQKLIRERHNLEMDAKENELKIIQRKQEEDAIKMNQDLEKKSHSRYLQYIKDKKSETNCRDKMLDTALVAHGRRMQPETMSKAPYQKSVR